jgi:diaminopimelate epimerase
MKIPFAKMVASGNDFVVIDNRDEGFDPGDHPLIKRICTRRLAIGADGLILLEGDEHYDFSMKYFNSDGREASMCGNGGRCIALYACLLGLVKGQMSFRAKAGIYEASIESLSGEEADVTLSMPEPTNIRPENDIKIGEVSLIYGSIDTGVPHVVLKADDLESLDVVTMGNRIRHHPLFEERGTNVNFIEVKGQNRIQVRTYERGVEDETLSCGTGAVASAIVASIWKAFPGPIVVGTASGEDVIVSFEKKGSGFKNVSLRGEARIVYRGVVSTV